MSIASFSARLACGEPSHATRMLLNISYLFSGFWAQDMGRLLGRGQAGGV
jgi:hypothetical protein